MNTHADKTQENKSQSVANGESQLHNGGKSTFQFVDNRPEAVTQRKLQEMANNSPRVKELRVFQSKANNHTTQQPIQREENNTRLLNDLKSVMNEGECSADSSVAQLKIGRSDGSNDLNAEQLKTWLSNSGLWGSLDDNVLDILELMMQSGHQWLYSGMGSAHLVIEARELTKDVHYEQGLIHGDLIRGRNEADFHVNPGDGGSLIADMLVVAEDAYDKMTVVSWLPGRPDGRLYLRPQGAAIIKIVSQLLGEALGNPQMIEVAHEHIRKRKTKEALMSYVPFYTKKMSKEILDKAVVPEHLAYMYSLMGDTGVDIKPLLVGNTLTMEEFVKNMLENSIAGRARLEKYINTVEGGNQAVSMDIYIERSKLPAIIAKLRG